MRLHDLPSFKYKNNTREAGASRSQAGAFTIAQISDGIRNLEIPLSGAGAPLPQEW